MVTKAWHVYGAEGHRQRESFAKSQQWTTWDGVECMILNHDMTGVYDSSVLVVTAKTAEECDQELESQISDGVFENSRVGRILPVAIPDLFLNLGRMHFKYFSEESC